MEKNQALLDFFQHMIVFRKCHPAIRRNFHPNITAFPASSVHGVSPWIPDYSFDSHMIAVMHAGYDTENRQEDIVYMAVNSYWDALPLTLPELPIDFRW